MCLYDVLLGVMCLYGHGHMYVLMFNDISKKMHYVFNEMRKWMLSVNAKLDLSQTEFE